ncbi:ArsR family transcriptional regulator [mine drainage metagenome]|uniref:ArsR family transcriptional regulator n=1 Tax=mine drainage metagenome TaxID=410659 RepID=T0Z1X7_9ZZZZ
MTKDELTAKELLELLDSPSVTIVHIMSREAFMKYRIKNSIWIPFFKIEDHDFSLLDMEMTIVTYCKDKSCMSSEYAAGILRENGFNALAYRGGVAEWKALGYPSEPDTPEC